MLRAPEMYEGGATLPDGALWPAQYGERQWRLNPRHHVPKAAFHIVRLWFRCQGAMSAGPLPEPGGINQQPAWLLAAFGLLGAKDAEIEQAKKGS